VLLSSRTMLMLISCRMMSETEYNRVPTTLSSDLSSYGSLSRLSGLGPSSLMKVSSELLTSLMKIYQTINKRNG
jgi:hypothetical protein